jgi:hypothetical protein
MAAVQVQTTSTTLLAADPDQWRTVVVQNLGPNAIFLETTGAATAAGGLQVAATTGLVTLTITPNTTVAAIAATANQTTPADTRLLAL